jgi:uncharacterized protein YprB with RNaseH-like and TPR domain/predicted nuclease with RNAse H fold
MLKRTFIHIPGIGKETERRLWVHGIHSWDDADRFEKRFGIAGARLQQILDEYIPRSREAIRKRDVRFFDRLCTSGEAWRLYSEFADDCVYLDIETTGLSMVFDSVTMVGLYDGRKYRAFIEGENLDQFADELARYSIVITFNGSGFDLRFLKLAFPDVRIPPIHIDLRWVTRKLGLCGGLKEVENRVGITRPNDVADLSGYNAAVLWSKYLRGERSALERLVQYNTEDVVHLKAIMEIAYDRLFKRTAVFLKEGTAPVFSGVAKVPRASRIVVRGATPKSASTDIVKSLLKKLTHQPRIVGIDLAGSERRASGWALMDGGSVSTKALRTDDQLVRETLAAHPHLISIDSPLSLPESVKNVDAVSGPIYRKCELALKRMGISVFWCLLPSMQSLTLRGMKLAAALREAGVNVIESYPGAAQDLLGIPRKGASLEELKWGLYGAGIRGDFLTASISHDEADAITSALVGLFYLADEYIALGTTAEDYLIVPRSPKINYAKLDEIVSFTGLAKIGCSDRLSKMSA